MDKHERFAKREWKWFIMQGFRPSEYGFEVNTVDLPQKHIDVYIEKLAAVRRKHDVPEVEE